MQTAVLRQSPRRPWISYGIAVFAVAVSASVRAATYDALDGELPFITFFPAVIVASVFGGVGAGFLATLLSMGVAWFWMQPIGRLEPVDSSDFVRMGLFTVVSLMAAYVCDRARRAGSEAWAASITHARLAAIVESSDDAILSKTLDGTIQSWNAAAERLFGYTAAEAIGKPIYFIVPPDRHAEEDDILAKLRRGEPISHYETVRVRKDGSPVDVSVTVSPVRDARGTIVGASKIVHDITDQRRAEAERQRIAQERESLLAREREARAEAERVGRIKDEFLATLSHELRTPLNAILGWSQILRLSPAGEDVPQGLATIERNARAQAQIIEDLLEMSRIISGKVQLDIQPIELPAVILAAVETIRPAADAKNIQLRTALDRHAGPTSGDANRLQQVFWNLLSNAVKFTPRGGMVQVAMGRAETHLEVSISDTGEGISAEFLPYVFDRFRQADASTTRRHGGLGLGLSIVRHLVELHGGEVRAESPGRGQGATFIVTLPLNAVRQAIEEPPEGERPAAKSWQLPDSVTLKGVRVLVVDDEPDARKLVERLLTDREAEVTTASSAAEAMESIRQRPPSILLTDIGMPEEDGYALLRQVRALALHEAASVPVIALTAYARPDDRTQAMLAGFQMHLAKPVEPGELIATVASLIGRAKG